jgi:serine/threonine protein kinase
VIPIITAVASALDYAHKQSLLHRDVKPANVMVTHLDDEGDQRILLVDFGIARNIDDISGITKTNMTVGTVAYCAPEQLLGEDIDGRADQYSLAANAFHLLTGTQLFPHSNPLVVSNRHLNVAPPSLAGSRPELARLDPVLATALPSGPKTDSNVALISHPPSSNKFLHPVLQQRLHRRCLHRRAALSLPQTLTPPNPPTTISTQINTARCQTDSNRMTRRLGGEPALGDVLHMCMNSGHRIGIPLRTDALAFRR